MAKKTRKTWDSYSDYLKSDQWQTIKAEVHERDGDHCQVCGMHESELVANGLAWHCHHWKYASDWSDDSVNNVVKICSKCHDEIHVLDFTHFGAQTYPDYLIMLQKNMRDQTITNYLCKLIAQMIVSFNLDVTLERRIIIGGMDGEGHTTARITCHSYGDECVHITDGIYRSIVTMVEGMSRDADS